MCTLCTFNKLITLKALLYISGLLYNNNVYITVQKQKKCVWFHYYYYYCKSLQYKLFNINIQFLSFLTISFHHLSFTHIVLR